MTLFKDVHYTATTGKEYIINGGTDDFIEELSHKILFSIETSDKTKSFSYQVGIAHALWSNSWNITPENKDQIEKVKSLYIEKAKRLLDANKEEFIDITLTAVNTSSTLDDAVNIASQST